MGQVSDTRGGQDPPVLLTHGAVQKGCQELVQRGAIYHHGDPRRVPKRNTKETSFMGLKRLDLDGSGGGVPLL